MARWGRRRPKGQRGGAKGGARCRCCGPSGTPQAAGKPAELHFTRRQAARGAFEGQVGAEARWRAQIARSGPSYPSAPPRQWPSAAVGLPRGLTGGSGGGAGGAGRHVWPHVWLFRGWLLRGRRGKWWWWRQQVGGAGKDGGIAGEGRAAAICRRGRPAALSPQIRRLMPPPQACREPSACSQQPCLLP